MASFLTGVKNAVTGKDDKQNNQQQQQQQQHNQTQQQHAASQQQHAPSSVPMGQVAPDPNWSTTLGQCDPPASCGDFALSLFCPQCMAASAKSQMDGSNVCFNFLCWTWCGAAAVIRKEYHIRGTPCDDLGNGYFCYPCLIRRAYTEVKRRGTVVNPLRAVPGVMSTRRWQTTVFDCNCCDFFEALICPFCVASRAMAYVQPYDESSCCADMFMLIPCGVYGEVRQRYGILAEFGCFEDVCVALACYPCALAQAEREARIHYAANYVKKIVQQVQQRSGGGCCCCC